MTSKVQQVAFFPWCIFAIWILLGGTIAWIRIKSVSRTATNQKVELPIIKLDEGGIPPIKNSSYSFSSSPKEWLVSSSSSLPQKHDDDTRTSTSALLSQHQRLSFHHDIEKLKRSSVCHHASQIIRIIHESFCKSMYKDCRSPRQHRFSIHVKGYQA